MKFQAYSENGVKSGLNKGQQVGITLCLIQVIMNLSLSTRFVGGGSFFSLPPSFTDLFPLLIHPGFKISVLSLTTVYILRRYIDTYVFF